MNKVALFTGQFSSVTGFLIAMGTRCEITHSAVFDGDAGEWLDASESRGGFGLMDTARFAGRECFVFEFAGDLAGWREAMMGRRYDWWGVGAWALVALNRLFGRGDGGLLRVGRWIQRPGDFFCFEATDRALEACGYDPVGFPVSGCQLRDKARGGVRFMRFAGVC